MDVIGLTGGIGAGKSTVARRLAERGAVVIDADILARAAVEPGSSGLEAVRQRFGDGVITANGELDRAALGQRVFQHEHERVALNAIVHPEVSRLYRERLEQIEREQPDAIVVYDVPLLVEARSAHEFALIVVVHAPSDQRIDRLVRLRGFDREAAEYRVNAQAADDERLAIADIVIDTSGSLESTLEQVDALWGQLVARRPGHTRVSDPLS
ncbi:MAG: dephospho-CoA kinase [Microcella sp.]|nr:dephospho-CoA kinase [Microcella sp.]